MSESQPNLDALNLKTGQRKGAMLYYNGTQWRAVPKGEEGQVLTVNSDGIPRWGDAFIAGMIMMWAGSVAEIPDGWQLCDGSNGTPDLRDRFVVGAGDTYSVDDTGGTDTQGDHTHTPDGSHRHDEHVPSDENMQFGTPGNEGLVLPQFHENDGSHDHNTHQHDTNLPPYYALAFIQKVSS